MQDNQGVPASPAGHSATPEPVVSALRASVPNARLRYAFFTPYHRGRDLVWDFLCNQPDAAFSDGTLTIKGSYGYELARNLELFADGQQIGSGSELWERFAPLEPVFHMFWNTFEQAATDWQEGQRVAKIKEAAERRRRDNALCEKVLTAAAQVIEARRVETVKQGSIGDESAVA